MKEFLRSLNPEPALSIYRREITHRLALLGFVCFATGLSCGYVVWHFVGLIAMAAIVQGNRAKTVVMVASLAGLILAVRPVALDFDTKPVQKQVTVLSMPYDYGEGSWVIAQSQAGTRYGLALKTSEILVPGQVVIAAGRQQPLSESRTADKGLVAEIVPIGLIRTVRAGFEPLKWAVQLRRRFVALAQEALPPDLAAATDALCMGQGSGITDDHWVAFQRTGTVSVVVASGLHAALAALLIFSAMRWLPIPRHLKLSVTFAFVLLYACAAGFHPPIVRGLLTAFIASVYYLFGREKDTLNSLGVAGLVSLLFDHWAVFDPGLWLTLTAVGALALFGPDEEALRVRTIKAWFWPALQSSALVTLATAPILALCFGQVPIAGLVVNLIALPALEASLAICLVSLFLSYVSWGSAVWVLQEWLQPVIGGMTKVVEWVSTWPFACANVGSFSPYWLLPIYGGMLLYWRPKIVPAP